MKNTLYFGIILIIVIIINIFIGKFLIEGYVDMPNTDMPNAKKPYTNMAIKYANYANYEYVKKFGISDTSNNITDISYNADPYYNVQYHADTYDVSGDINKGTAYVVDKSGNIIALPPTGLEVTPTYYQPGSYRFGASTYVPNYEDSIYLSQTTGESTVTPILNQASISKGFCSYYVNQPDKLEEACMNTDPNNCASTSCCVLLGGSKCVSGNKQGPYMKENYGDTTILNRDYYYYKGKCYGNCSGNILSYQSLDASKTSDISNVGSDLSKISTTPPDNSTTPPDNSTTQSAKSTTSPDNSTTQSATSTTSPDNSTTQSATSTGESGNTSSSKVVTANITQPVNTVTTITNKEVS